MREAGGGLGWRAVVMAFAAAFAAERGQLFLWVPVAVGLGIVIYFTLPTEPALGLALGLAALLSGAALTARRALRGEAGWLLLAFLAFVSIGFAAATVKTARVAAPVLTKRVGPLTLTAVVDEVEYLSTRQVRLVLKIETMERLAPELWPARIRISVRTGGDVVAAGDRITTLVSLWPPPAPSIPGDFDFGRQLYFKRIGALGVAIAPLRRLEAVDRQSGSFRAHISHRVEMVRLAVSARIRAGIPGTEGLVADALVTGYRGALPKAVDHAMRNSGLAHLLAISGMHMSMVTGIVFFAIRTLFSLIEPIALRYPIKKWAAAGAALGAFGYLGLSGANIPAERAFIMAGLALFAIVIDRQPLSLRLVALAAFLLLLLEPESILGVSFQMSFAAVIALISAYGAARHWRSARPRQSSGFGRISAYVGGLLASSIIAEVAVAVPGLYHFNQMPIFALAANMIAIPVAGAWIMPCLSAAVILMPLGLEALPLYLAGQGIAVVIATATRFAAFTSTIMVVPSFSVVAYGIIMFGGLWLALWRTRLRLFGLLFVVLGGVLVLTARQPDIMVEGDGDLIGLRAPDGHLWLSPGRASGFSRDRWTRMAGHASTAWKWAPLAEGGAGGDGDGAPWLSCDSLGCLYRPDARTTIAIVRDANAFAEDCPVADLVISKLSVPRACHAAEPVGARPGSNAGSFAPRLIVGRAEQRRNGGHIVTIDRAPDGTPLFSVQTVGEFRNDRPWSGKVSIR